MIGTIHGVSILGEENYDTIVTKIALYSSKLLKKPDQCRAIYMCSHLFWCPAPTVSPQHVIITMLARAHCCVCVCVTVEELQKRQTSAGMSTKVTQGGRCLHGHFDARSFVCRNSERISLLFRSWLRSGKWMVLIGSGY